MLIMQDIKLFKEIYGWFIEMKKILVTGGAGFIGSSLVDRLVQEPDNHITVVDNLLTGRREYILKNAQDYQFIKCDVNNFKDISAVMLSNNFDYVFHYAAVVGVQRTLNNPMMVLNDIDGIKNVLNLAKNTGVKTVFFSSSSEIYGESVEFPQHEHTTPLNSRLPYAVVKNAAEAFLRTFQEEYNLNYTIFRFFNTYGPRQSADFVISKFIDAALKGKDIPIYGDGNQSRTFCYIDDNLEATTNILKQNLYENDVVNIGNDNETSVLELAQLIIKLTDSKSKILHLPPLKQGDMKRRVPDASRMQEILGRNFITLKNGLEKIINQK